MTVNEFIDLLKRHSPDANVRFSVADDDSPDDGERWFVDDGVLEIVAVEGEVTICLVGQSNMQ